MELKPIWIAGRDINDVWYQILYALLEIGRPYHKSSGSRVNLESGEPDMLGFDFLAGYIHYPHTESRIYSLSSYRESSPDNAGRIRISPSDYG
jgi:hypothetical protein